MPLAFKELLALSIFSCCTQVVCAGDTERLAIATEQYARCLDAAVGNFATDEEAKSAARRLSTAMLKNIRVMVAEERKKPGTNASFWIEMLGEEAFVGYLFKSFSDVSDEYRRERQVLKEKNKFDWRVTNQQLWSRGGCEAIHSQLRG